MVIERCRRLKLWRGDDCFSSIVYSHHDIAIKRVELL